MRAVLVKGLVVLGALLGSAIAARAQEPPPTAQAPAVISEELEPRVVGRSGLTTIGIAGFVDRFYSSERLYPALYTINLDGSRFITRRFAVRLGISGSGQFGGDDEEEPATGPGAPALHAGGGLLFYFTPDSMLSLYTGAEYWSQVTRRAEGDRGTGVAKLGLHAALSSRASVFFEAGVGIAVRRGSDGDLPTRMTGQIGVRFKL